MFFFKKKSKPEQIPEPVEDLSTPYEKALRLYRNGQYKDVIEIARAGQFPERHYLWALSEWKLERSISGYFLLKGSYIEDPRDPELSPLMKEILPDILKQFQRDAKELVSLKFYAKNDSNYREKAERMSSNLRSFLEFASCLLSKEQFELCKNAVSPHEELLWQLYLEYGYEHDDLECVNYIKSSIERFRQIKIFRGQSSYGKTLELLKRHPELDTGKEIDLITRLEAFHSGDDLMRRKKYEEGLKELEAAYSQDVPEAAREIAYYYGDRDSDHYDETKAKYWRYLADGGDPAVSVEFAVRKKVRNPEDILPEYDVQTAQNARFFGYEAVDAADDEACRTFVRDQEFCEAGSLLLYAQANFKKAERSPDRQVRDLYEAHGDKWFRRCEELVAEDDQVFVNTSNRLLAHRDFFYEVARKMLRDNNPREAFLYFKAAADCGKLEAVCAMVFCYGSGCGTSKDLDQARRYANILKETDRLEFSLYRSTFNYKEYFDSWIEIGREGSRVLLLEKEISGSGSYFEESSAGFMYKIAETFFKPFICDRQVKRVEYGRDKGMVSCPYFYLTIEDAVRYLGPLEEKTVKRKTFEVLSNPLAVAQIQKEAVEENFHGISGPYIWWLRDRGKDYSHYCTVGASGAIDRNGSDKESHCGDRYAVWIDLDWFLKKEED